MEHFNVEEIDEYGSILTLDTTILKQNLDYFKSLINPNTFIMAMVKAVAYGHGAIRIASELEKYKAVNYLGVANIQKGIELRKAGIELPIMVTNPVSGYFHKMCEYCLEPVLHNQDLAESFSDFISNSSEIDSNYPVHIKFNTGMNRFGFDLELVNSFLKLFRIANWKVKSVMSHLSCSDEESEDEFTLKQFETFKQIKLILEKELPGDTIWHILNTNGVIRFPEFQYDMVRVGIGLYGASEYLPAREFIKPVGTFKAQIAQIRHVKKGESISYSRGGRANENKYIGILAVGYADGFPRSLGNGNWKVEFNGKLFPTIGNVCMDYTMIDLGIEKNTIALEEYVTIFGGIQSIFEYAKAQNTICYEAMTDLGNRVQRILID